MLQRQAVSLDTHLMHINTPRDEAAVFLPVVRLTTPYSGLSVQEDFSSGDGQAPIPAIDAVAEMMRPANTSTRTVSPFFMALLVIFNLVTTVAYVIMYKVGQTVLTQKNTLFLTIFSSIVEFGIGTIIVIINVLRGNLKICSNTTSGNLSRRMYVQSVVLVAGASSIPLFVWAVTGPQVRGSVQGIFNLLLVPCTYFLSITVLKRTYPLLCKVGCALVLLGAVISTVSSLKQSDDGVGDTNEQTSLLTVVLCHISYAVAYSMYAYQYIVTEQVLHTGSDLWMLQSLCGWVEVIFMVCITPLQSIALRALGEDPLPFSFEGGFRCLAGQDLACRQPMADGGELEPVWWPLFVFFAVSVSSVFNDLAYMLLTKYGSAAFMSVSDGASVGMVALVTTMPFMGSIREEPNVYMVLSCVICGVGMLAWYKGEQGVLVTEGS